MGVIHTVMGHKPKIALLVEAPEVEGGIQAAAHRHARLMAADFDIIPVAFQKSRRERDWPGSTERITTLGQDAYLVTAADLSNDNRISGTSGIQNVRQDTRFRSWADHLIEIVRDNGIEMIHAFGAFHQRGLIAAYAAAKCGVPNILSLRGVDLETRLFDTMLAPLSQSIAAASSVVCVSDDSRRTVEGVFAPRGPVHVIRNHFDPSIFQDAEPDIPLLRGSSVPVIGCFGKFRRIMGLDVLLDAFEMICERRDAVLMLGGSIQKREVEYYNARLESCRALRNIIRLGSIPHAQMLGYLRRCSVAAFPSISDASPNKILEAMYAGVPVVSTTAGGIPELVEDGAEALLTRPRCAEALAGAIERLLDDRDLAARLTANAYRRVTTEHRIEDERTAWAAVYREGLSLRPALR
ncbi:glycosyltransferase family 4 protein [Mangrovicoccus ximenensis]|uniref:glycosyltransferase family 4 protein n=1 Tax=Mangrovicoccus ximenensis TaxID=1911570 RepID=UPI000D3D610E|nr:glycosyltransferase family 4 protein [Mangrovicoccus ximenensis]